MTADRISANWNVDSDESDIGRLQMSIGLLSKIVKWVKKWEMTFSRVRITLEKQYCLRYAYLVKNWVI